VFRRICCSLVVIDCLLVVAHLLWPQYEWGQGRESYFNLGNRLTLASWYTAAKLTAVAILALVAFFRESHCQNDRRQRPWMWFGIGGLALLWSFVEISQIHNRLELLDYNDPDAYSLLTQVGLGLIVMVVMAAFLWTRLKDPAAPQRRCMIGWIVAWLAAIAISALIRGGLAGNRELLVILRGLGQLAGTTMLLAVIGAVALRPPAAVPSQAAAPSSAFPSGRRSVWLLIGVGGTTFSIIYLQIILFQMMMIFADYLTATFVISIALLGLAVGGLVGAYCAGRAAISAMTTAALILPFGIMLAFGTAVKFMPTPLLASLLMMVPFACGSAVITVALARAKSHLVYFIDLLGAAIGALAVCFALGAFREESSLLFLSAFTAALVICYAIHLQSPWGRGLTIALAAALCLGFVSAGVSNLQNDIFNVVRYKVQQRHPKANIMYSRSSFVGRYDIVKRSPNSNTIKAYNNGRTIDTMRPTPPEEFQIDPRMPHTYLDNPSILILGLSGDGVAKTSRFLSDRVVGIEINPRIVELQSKELIPFNGDSYKDIEVHAMDGRSYLEAVDEQFDIVTLMNAHGARGAAEGSAPSPEYLFTLEAFQSYFDHMPDRGILNIEEPINRPRREPPVWKMIVTIRQALIDRGIEHPENHFFVFQWRTTVNNYIQVVVKKTPLTGTDVSNLRRWLDEVDRVRQIEREQNRKLGPIRSLTTILHMPYADYDTNYTRLLKGEVDAAVLQARNLRVTTDNRPFHFDVDPRHPNIRKACIRAMLMSLLLLPFFVGFLVRRRGGLRKLLPFVLAVGLTGLGYFLIEVVLIERYEIFIGSPVVTFSTILGTLLIFSGLGSLWSGRVKPRQAYMALGAVFVMLILQQFLPRLFPVAAALPLAAKVVLVIVAVAPLAFCMGVPFPFVLRLGKDRYEESSAGMLFAFNSVASALAVPLSMNISTSYGLNTTFTAGIVVYLVVVLLLASMHQPGLQMPANAIAVVVAGTIFAGPWISRQEIETGAPGRYEIYAISYGRSIYGDHKIFSGGSREKAHYFEWMFWVVKGGGRTILIDTGFDDANTAKRWGIDNYISPIERLRQFGIEPESVSDVILTHMHWDHVGAVRHFTNAKVWLQKSELEHAQDRLSAQKQNTKGMRWADLAQILEVQEQGRLQLVDGDLEPFPGIELHLGGAHTPGTQYINIETADGPVVVAGDITYLYENNRRHKPIGVCVDPQENLATIRRLHRQAATPFLILPGHGPQVMRWFPKVQEGIVQISTIAP
jgi:glyoxylase-like metal-dependent hydrolase (beta-lactamase superfamily II)